MGGSTVTVTWPCVRLMRLMMTADMTVVLHLNLYDLISLCIFHICIVILSVSFVNISSPQSSGYSTGGLLKAALELQK